MNVLFVVPYVPSLVRTRSYNLIRHLSARGHRVTVATLWSNDRERAEAEDLKRSCHAVEAVHLPATQSLVNCLRALPGAEPLQAAYSWSPQFLERVKALQAKADVVHVEHLRGARYATGAMANDGATAPVVWDSVDCISHLFEQAVNSRGDRLGRLVNRLELPRTQRHEGWLVRQFDRVVITSETDRKAIEALGAAAAISRSPVRGEGEPVTSSDVVVVPNGVDTEYFTPTGEEREAQTLIFSGKMSYHANVSAVTHLVADVMPRVWSRLPDVRLSIVGKDPPKAVRALVASNPSRLTVTGTVPDVRPFLRRASIAVIPLVYGAGSQFKVLEAMACETPVVATSRAVAALQARAERDVLVADGAERFAIAIIELLQSTAARRGEVGQAGRRYVEANHRWTRIAAGLESVYEDARARRFRLAEMASGSSRTA